jgi:hypothetical protein
MMTIVLAEWVLDRRKELAKHEEAKKLLAFVDQRLEKFQSGTFDGQESRTLHELVTDVMISLPDLSIWEDDLIPGGGG